MRQRRVVKMSREHGAKGMATTVMLLLPLVSRPGRRAVGRRSLLRG
jgi:hypothetical protein